MTTENTSGISVLVEGASGLIMRGCDFRSNLSVGPHYAHVLLDGSSRVVDGVDIDSNTILQIDGGAPIVSNCPVTAFQGVGTLLGRVDITRTTFGAFDTANQKRYGDGLFSALYPTVQDTAGVVFAPGNAQTVSFTTANPTASPDLRKGKKHVFVLSGAASGLLTINTPIVTGIAGSALSGAEYEVIVINNTGVTIALNWLISTKGAPTTIAAGDTKSGKWSFNANAGWIQSSAWI